uniref:Uncharacterized protein n=1 Tax=Candidatus Kentrum sp. DK TaxID=2126562 RepID=A0A450S0K1_9GAMM|nr:MAG: hypothetical protein BECKDK2373B_GA0170837_100910 [Candidatus Kentron sp. DK]VFJ54995.1 MAG: hypothetical protein BECKDK2373C_GA0170839_104619 [Candidatus Kentron sp. DK]
MGKGENGNIFCNSSSELDTAARMFESDPKLKTNPLQTKEHAASHALYSHAPTLFLTALRAVRKRTAYPVSLVHRECYYSPNETRRGGAMRLRAL